MSMPVRPHGLFTAVVVAVLAHAALGCWLAVAPAGGAQRGGERPRHGPAALEVRWMAALPPAPASVAIGREPAIAAVIEPATAAVLAPVQAPAKAPAIAPAIGRAIVPTLGADPARRHAATDSSPQRDASSASTVEHDEPAPPPLPSAVFLGLSSADDFVPPNRLERAAVPRSAPDASPLEGLPFSGLPLRLRLFVDRAGTVLDVAVLQASEDDEVLQRVRRMFLETAFIAGRLDGLDVASYKDIELTLGPAR